MPPRRAPTPGLRRGTTVSARAYAAVGDRAPGLPWRVAVATGGLDAPFQPDPRPAGDRPRSARLRRPASAPSTAAEAGLPWWSERTFYEVFVRSFKDSDGDGIGDFNGLTAVPRLPQRRRPGHHHRPGSHRPLADAHLRLTLLPRLRRHRLPGGEPGLRDHGGLPAFLAAAHERGIAVLIDLVLNHTSDEHPWFQASADGDPAYADWYLWRDESPGLAGPVGPAGLAREGRAGLLRPLLGEDARPEPGEPGGPRRVVRRRPLLAGGRRGGRLPGGRRQALRGAGAGAGGHGGLATLDGRLHRLRAPGRPHRPGPRRGVEPQRRHGALRAPRPWTWCSTSTSARA